jgi:hypothetical protein
MGTPILSPNLEKKWKMWSTFGQMGVLIGLCILLMDPHMDRFGQMGRIWGVSLGDVLTKLMMRVCV